jgi:hypothetical protein
VTTEAVPDAPGQFEPEPDDVVIQGADPEGPSDESLLSVLNGLDLPYAEALVSDRGFNPDAKKPTAAEMDELRITLKLLREEEALLLADIKDRKSAHIEGLIASGKYDDVAPGEKYPQPGGQTPLGHTVYYTRDSTGGRGVQFNLLHVPGTRDDLVALLALKSQAKSALTEFFKNIQGQ